MSYTRKPSADENDAQLLLWAKKGLEAIRKEYHHLGQPQATLDQGNEGKKKTTMASIKKRMSSLWHQAKGRTKTGNIEVINNALDMINYNPLRNIADKRKLLTTIRTLYRLVKPNFSLDYDHHHTRFMAFLFLKKLLPLYNKTSTHTGMELHEIQETLNKKDIDEEKLVRRYPLLVGSLLKSPQDLDSVFFSDVKDTDTASELLKKTGCKAMLRATPSKSEHTETLGVVMLTVDMGKGEYGSREFVLTKKEDEWSWVEWDGSAPNLEKLANIKSNEQLLRVPEIRTASLELLRLANAKGYYFDIHALFPVRGGVAENDFKDHCLNRMEEERESEAPNRQRWF